ncbi:cyclin-dependent kinase inhibitor 1C [Chanos chanos]|uniref:Cyclin-dependent kinase inhibitor 1C n=1 Tax=Chanos chanos TaxID=29144 RepID=A0A6J2W540_CHACN|nr:cyclin-dependent kinase inhibitor 1C-like [Chanos chanos]
MSNVQLSTSALERLVARRTFPLHARTSVCRNLFGPVDHDELNREIKSKLREISERDQQKWNFNFETGTPLSGDYEWEETQGKSPAFYQESVQIGRTRVVLPVKPCVDVTQMDSSVKNARVHCEDRLSTSQSNLDLNQENCAVKHNSGKLTGKIQPFTRRKRTTEFTTTYITDFYTKRRRTPGVKQGESCLHPSTPIPVEQTPRKRMR